MPLVLTSLRAREKFSREHRKDPSTFELATLFVSKTKSKSLSTQGLFLAHVIKSKQNPEIIQGRHCQNTATLEGNAELPAGRILLMVNHLAFHYYRLLAASRFIFE